MNTDDALGRGMDFAIGTLLFFGLGFGLDRWLGTTPLFMILLVVVGIVGQFARIWFRYEHSMRALEAERAAGSRARAPGGSTPQGPPGAAPNASGTIDRVGA